MHPFRPSAPVAGLSFLDGAPLRVFGSCPCPLLSSYIYCKYTDAGCRNSPHPFPATDVAIHALFDTYRELEWGLSQVVDKPTDRNKTRAITRTTAQHRNSDSTNNEIIPGIVHTPDTGVRFPLHTNVTRTLRTIRIISST